MALPSVPEAASVSVAPDAAERLLAIDARPPRFRMLLSGTLPPPIGTDVAPSWTLLTVLVFVPGSPG